MLAYAIESVRPGGKIEVVSGRNRRRRATIERGATNSPRGPLLQVRGLPFSMNAILVNQFAGRWDPVAHCWSLPTSRGIALRAYLHDNF